MADDTVKQKEQVTPKAFDLPSLPKFELVLCAIIWAGNVIYGCYGLYILGYNKKTIEHFVRSGRIKESYFGLYKYEETNLWSETWTLLTQGWPYFLIYLLVSKVLRAKTSPNVFMLSCIALSICFNYHLSSKTHIIIEILIFLLPAAGGLFRRKSIVWVIGLSMIYITREDVVISFLNLSDIYFHSFPYTVLLMTRGITVGLSIAKAPQYNMKLLLEMLFYYWYFPAIIGCRMMTIKEFVANIYNPCIVDNWKKWTWHVLRILFYMVAWNILQNLFHTELIIETHDHNSIPMLIWIGAQMYHGIHYYMTYLVLYNIGYLLCQADGFLTAEGPTCICHLALYTQMWRNFDKGMHFWIKRYIFIPIKKLGNPRITKHFSFFASFGFVLLFHGISKNIFFFILMSLVQSYSEYVIKYIYNHTWFGEYMEKRFSQLFIRRSMGIIVGTSFFISTFGFASYQHGYNSTYAMYSATYRKQPIQIFYRQMAIFLFSYSHAQISLTTNEMLRKRKLKSE